MNVTTLRSAGAQRQRIVSGMRPTGRLHLGNYEGALRNWVRLQDEYECYYFVADWHALTSEYADTSQIKAYTLDMVAVWLAGGLDPERSTLFVQSLVPEHAELHLLLSNITPLGWLERVPTYKEQRENITERDLGNYAFLGYPVLQTADILMYKAHKVPVGRDQVAHLELAREITRRFNQFYGDVFPEPHPLLTEVPVLPGLDNRKMSKSYGNFIEMGEPAEVVTKKIKAMFTDPQRVTRDIPGRPELCPVFAYHKLYSSLSEVERIDRDCRAAAIGCVECKSILATNVVEHFATFRERYQELVSKPEQLVEIMHEGSRKARGAAAETMREVREAIRVNWS